MPGFVFPQSWPRPADRGAAERLVERFAALGRAPARLAGQCDFGAMLRALGGNSPYLADLALREAGCLRVLAADGPGTVIEVAMQAIANTPPAARRERIAAVLRQAKRQVALAVAAADIGGVWSLERVTGALSDFAEAALGLAVAHLLRAAHDAGELRLPDPAAPDLDCGFTVLGMGKLGARELNYSSDVDLILLYDPDAHPDHPEGLRALFTRFARNLVSIMEARDADGYVFRTDLRLRPDPAATPPAIALPAAISYYESMGQNWERAAMIKARPVAGDRALGAQFLTAIRPFVWRRHLDFAAIAEIHAMKRRIDGQQKRGEAACRDPVARIAGHNVKLGHGGIREIEFLTQTLELVWGGRDPALRDPRTLPALRLLARAGHLPQRAASELAGAYRFLRRVEHRLQMVADRQTHALPTRSDELAGFAAFMGYADAPGFAQALLRQLDQVRARYAQLFEFVPEAPEQVAALDFSGVGEAPAATIAALEALGFREIERIVAAVRGWRSGRVRAVRSERARELLGGMLPLLLKALGRQRQPDQAFARFEAFFARLPAGVQLLSLFQRNPALLDRVAAVLGAAPSLADHLADVPSALEGLLAPLETNREAADRAPLRALEAQLADASQLEQAIEIIRRIVRGEEFRLDVAVLEGRIDIDAAGAIRTGLADAAITSLLPRVMADFTARNGRVRGGGLVVVALGKAGGREMLAGSDLDLMLVYDHPPAVTESSGGRMMPVSQYYIRAAHTFVAALTAPGLEGPLYAVDMRLRPSGNKGPVAVSLSAFRRYHAENAWTWERMALTRARVVAGPPALAGRVEAAIRAAIIAGEPDRIREDARAMRARLARDLPPGGPWDVKLLPGGLMEVEFVAQALQLVHARDYPDLCSPTTRIALTRLRDAGLLAAADAELLIRADRVWRSVQGILRLVLGRAVRGDPPEAALPALLHALGQPAPSGNSRPPETALASLRAALDRLADEVRAAFIRLIGDPEVPP